MGSAISKTGKVASKCTKCCPKRLKCCSKVSKGSKRTVRTKVNSKLPRRRSTPKNTSDKESDAPTEDGSGIHAESEGGDLFSNWWDSFFCKCCAPCKRMFVADKPNLESMESELSIQQTPNLTFLGDVRIHPADILRVTNNSRAPPPIVPEPMMMVLKI